jgi:hypothetical protein
LAETHKKALKAKEAEVTQKLGEEGQMTLTPMAKEAEIKARKQLSERHIVELGRLDIDHIAQRERIREELRCEYEKLLNDWRHSSQHASIFEGAVKRSDCNLSLIYFQDSMEEDQLKAYYRSNMTAEGMHPRRAFEPRQRLPDKQLVEVMSEFARKAEDIYKFIHAELEDCLAEHSSQEPVYPEIKALLHSYLAQIGESNSGFEVSSDKHFLMYGHWVFIAADKVVQDLELVKAALLTATTSPYQPPLSEYSEGR